VSVLLHRRMHGGSSDATGQVLLTAVFPRQVSTLGRQMPVESSCEDEASLESSRYSLLKPQASEGGGLAPQAHRRYY